MIGLRFLTYVALQMLCFWQFGESTSPMDRGAMAFLFAAFSFLILVTIIPFTAWFISLSVKPSPTQQGCTPAGGVGDECPDVKSTSLEVEKRATGGVTTPEAHSCRASGYESSEGAHRV